MALKKIAQFDATHGTATHTAKVYRDSEYQEFRVRLYVDNVLRPDADCFTSDKTDALSTARHCVTVGIK